MICCRLLEKSCLDDDDETSDDVGEDNGLLTGFPNAMKYFAREYKGNTVVFRVWVYYSVFSSLDWSQVTLCC